MVFKVIFVALPIVFCKFIGGQTIGKQKYVVSFFTLDQKTLSPPDFYRGYIDFYLLAFYTSHFNSDLDSGHPFLYLNSELALATFASKIDYLTGKVKCWIKGGDRSIVEGDNECANLVPRPEVKRNVTVTFNFVHIPEWRYEKAKANNKSGEEATCFRGYKVNSETWVGTPSGNDTQSCFDMLAEKWVFISLNGTLLPNSANGHFGKFISPIVTLFSLALVMQTSMIKMF